MTELASEIQDRLTEQAESISPEMAIAIVVIAIALIALILSLKAMKMALKAGLVLAVVVVGALAYASQNGAF